MANTKISALTSATTPVAGTETLPIVQSNTTKKVSIANLTVGRAVDTLSVSSTGPNGIPITLQEITAAPSSATAAYVAVTTSAFPGGANGDLVLIPRTSSANDVRIYVGSGTPTEALVVQGSTKDVRIGSGNLVPATAAKGINFTANSAAAGMTSQLLNWYEEGAWTPVLRDGSAGTAATAAAVGGFYTKIGRQVTVTIRLINITTTGLTGTNQIYITGFPFASKSDVNAIAVSTVAAVSVTSTTGNLYAQMGDSVSYCQLYNGLTTGQSNALVSQIVSGSGQMFFTLTYTTA